VGTKRISQLDTLADGVLTGEAILPVVISDPLIPNRKAKINQIFKGVGAGSQSQPGLCFDLDRDTGLYQDSYNELGIAFGTSSMYYKKQDNADGSATIRLIAGDTTSSNVNIDMRPQGSGKFLVNGPAEFQDTNFFLADDQNPDKKAKFEISGVSTGAGIRSFALPSTGSFTSTTLVGNDTSQTLSNKTIIIQDGNFQIVGSSNSGKIALFETDSWEAPVTHIYRLPDYGTSASQSTIIDTITEQNISNKNLINPSISNIASGDPENPTPKVTFLSGDLTSDRIVTFPDQSLEVAGTEATQIFKNKDYADARFADATDVTKRILFDLSALPGATILRYAFPHQLLNVSLGNNNTLVTELAQQVLDNKSIRSLKLVDEENDQNQIHFDLSNIEGTKSISFPNASATLLSTENVGTLGVSFGGEISAPDFGGRLRLTNHFFAGF
tara:strand:- start:8405 stop:9730 length:1326 start_codon:yes stop_codon:yes gene_type:complete